RVADLEARGAADPHDGPRQRQGRLDQRETAVEVGADDEARRDRVAAADPDALGFVYDVTDGGDQAVVADAYAVTDTFGAEKAGAHRVVWYVCGNRDDGGHRRRGAHCFGAHRAVC